MGTGVGHPRQCPVFFQTDSFGVSATFVMDLPVGVMSRSRWQEVVLK
jgi:hypothetical protein